MNYGHIYLGVGYILLGLNKPSLAIFAFITGIVGLYFASKKP